MHIQAYTWKNHKSTLTDKNQKIKHTLKTAKVAYYSPNRSSEF